MYRRYRSRQESMADAERQAEDEEERVPLLQRCRHLLVRRNTSGETGGSVVQRFRSVIFGGRANVAPPEVPQVREGGNDEPSAPPVASQHREDHEPSAPPPPYEAINRDPIIRSGSLSNENYRNPERGSRDSVELRDMRPSSPTRSVRRLDEIPLSQSLH